MLYRLLNKEVDIVFTKIWLNRGFNFGNILTVPFAKNDVHFLVPRPKLRTNFWGPATPFTPTAWILIIIMLITQSLFVYTKARLFPTRVSKSNVTKFAKLIP